MTLQKYKVKLSPKLELGVGRGSNRGKILPYATILFFIVSGILGIRAGYMVFHRSPVEVPASPQVLGAVDSKTQPAFTDYVVKKGDTVFSIGQKSNIDWATIATLNSLEAPFKLSPGQILKLPNQ